MEFIKLANILVPTPPRQGQEESLENPNTEIKSLYCSTVFPLCSGEGGVEGLAPV
jgi:hypothetical protein